MFTSLAVVLVAIWLVVDAESTPSTTFTLIIGIVAGALALADLLRPYWPARRPAP